MPADDLVLNIRQIASYDPVVGNAPPSGALLIQTAGLGSAYASISPEALVSTALASPGADMFVGGQLSALSFQGGSAQFSNAAVSLLDVAEKATFRAFDASWGTIAGAPIATQAFASALVAGLQASTVWSFMGRRGDVRLWIQDILTAGGAPIFSPRFMGEPRAETPAPWSNSSRLATTAFVQRNSVRYIDNLLKCHPFVFSFNGRSGEVVLTNDDIIAAGGIAANSPVFTGVPLAPTAPLGTATDQIATTQFVAAALITSGFAPINSPAFVGYVTAPTPPFGTSDAQVATTAFVQAAVVASTTGVAAFNGRTGAIVLEAADVTGVGGALLQSPVFTGVPTGPTAPLNTTTNQLATCAFVMNELGGVASGVDSFNGRAGAVVLTSTDLTNAGGALTASPVFSGVPQAPTASTGTANAQLATTAFVMAAVGVSVSSFNGRTGAVTLTPNDVSAAGGLTNPSVQLTGVPTAPTPPGGTNSNQIATTAYVQAAIASGIGVASFNNRTGAVTLQTSDLGASVGGPFLPLSGGTLTGPLAGTASAWTANLTGAAQGSNVNISMTTPGSGTVGPTTGKFGLFVNAQKTGWSAAGAGTGEVDGAYIAVQQGGTGDAGALLLQCIGASNGYLVMCEGYARQQNLAGTILKEVDASIANINPSNGASYGLVLTSGAGANTTGLLIQTTASATWGNAIQSMAAGTTNFSVSGAGAVTAASVNANGTVVCTQINANVAAINGTVNCIGLSATGTATFTGPTVVSNAPFTVSGTQLVVTGPAGTTRQIVGQTVPNAARWVLTLGDNSPESGGNSGSDFYLSSYGDNVQPLMTVMGAFRASGNVTFSQIIAPIAFSCRQGTAGVTNWGNPFNLYWASPNLQAWIDTVNIGNLSYTSDYRIKKNIGPLGSMWATVKALNPIRYEHCNFSPSWPGMDGARAAPFIADDGVERWGFTAHELQETLVESAASGHKDEENLIQSPNPWPVLAALTKALQEAMQRIETLEARFA